MLSETSECSKIKALRKPPFLDAAFSVPLLYGNNRQCGSGNNYESIGNLYDKFIIALTDRVIYANITLSDRALIDRALIDRALIDRALPDRAVQREGCL